SNGWRVEVEVRAIFLETYGPYVALAMARAIAREIITVVEERVRRIDLCADFVSFDLDEIDVDAWHQRGHARPVRHTALSEHYGYSVRTGFDVGKGDTRLRVYNKTEELRVKGDAEKLQIEHDGWKAKGSWNGIDEVTRTEFQLRGDTIKELGLR